MRIQRLEIRNYKSLRHVTLDEIRGLNIVIGRNNSGKSNLLDALRFFFNKDGQGWADENSTTGVPRHLWFNYNPTEPIEISVSFRPPVLEAVRSMVTEIAESPALAEMASSPIQVSKMVYFQESSNITYFIIKSITWGRFPLVLPPKLDEYRQGQQARFIAKGSNVDSPQYMVTLDPNSPAKKVLNAIDNRFVLIPAKRRISERETRVTGEVPPPVDGTNLKNTLQRLKNSGQPRERQMFRSIKERIDELNFAVGSMESIEAGDVADLTFDKKELSFPLFSQGTGIHEILIFIVNLAIRRDCFFGIEEPENHLHYDAQRALLDILEQESERNQIFATSHSSLFVDRMNYDQGRVYLTRTGKEGETDILDIGGPDQFELIVDEIGPISSLLLPDAVVFVEGKSDESVFAAIAGTLKAFSRARLQFINMTGKTKLPYFAAISMILRTSSGLPFFYIVDCTPGRSAEQDIDDICKSARENVGLDDEQLKKLRCRVFVLSKPQIEAYLLKPSTISRVFELPIEDVKSWFDQNSARRNKFYVLDSLLRRRGKGKYDKTLDGARIAKALVKEEIDEELVRLVEQVVELSRKLGAD
jgi:hypothetical protein